MKTLIGDWRREVGSTDSVSPRAPICKGRRSGSTAAGRQGKAGRAARQLVPAIALATKNLTDGRCTID